MLHFIKSLFGISPERKYTESDKAFMSAYSAYNHPGFDRMIANWTRLSNDETKSPEIRKLAKEWVDDMVQSKTEEMVKIENM